MARISAHWVQFWIVTWVLLVGAARAQESEDDNDSDCVEEESDFWGTFGPGFVTETLLTTDPRYTTIADVLSNSPTTPAPAAPTVGRKKRQGRRYARHARPSYSILAHLCVLWEMVLVTKVDVQQVTKSSL